MSPADGAFIDIVAQPDALTPDLAIILPGGRCLLALSHLAETLPRRGNCGDAIWRATCWPAATGRAGLAFVDAPLVGTSWLRGPTENGREILSPRHIDIAAVPLADFVRRHGLNNRAVYDFLISVMSDTTTGKARESDRHFANDFLSLAAEPGGYVEILAIPDTGGLFAQGWAMSLDAGRHKLVRLDGTFELCDADVAVFPREDIPAPHMGFCLFSLDARAADLDALDCLLQEQNGVVKRFEILRGSVLKLRGEAAESHVRHMLPRLACEGKVIQRICRPRYQGIDTLSATALPVAAAFDAVFESPSGGLLAMGWLLDPLRHVERVILKSTAGLYAPLQDFWNPLPRADLNDGFASDPRFSRLLDAADCTHGFIAYSAGRPRQGHEEFYLELVLTDKTCLFRPLKITLVEGRELLPQILAAVPMQDPALDMIIKDALAPFLGELPPRRRTSRAAQRPIALSPDAGEITTVIPLHRLAHLQPMMALLSGTAAAQRLDLVIVMERAQAARAASGLKDLFAFYRLRGRLLPVTEQTDFCARIEAGLSLAKGERVLLWSPSALPATSGWLDLLEAELARQDSPGLISPTLIYEDGSVFYGGDGATADNHTPMLGYPLGWMTRGAPRAMPAGAAQIALIDRDAMAQVGGFSGHLYSDTMAHCDLARRLHEQKFGTWASGNVDFWMLEDPPSVGDEITRLLERVDSSLMGNMAATVSGDRLR